MNNSVRIYNVNDKKCFIFVIDVPFHIAGITYYNRFKIF